MKKKSTLLLVIAVLSALIIISTTALSTSTMFSIGTQYRNTTSISPMASKVIAEYNGKKITQEMVEYHLYIDSQRSPETRLNHSRSDVVDNLLAGLIIVDEALKDGLSVSASEVEDTIVLSQEAVKNDPQAAAALEAFCTGANMSLEDYWEQLEEELRTSLLRQNYKNLFIDNYLLSNPESTVEEAKSAYDQHREALIEQHRDEITYHEAIA